MYSWICDFLLPGAGSLMGILIVSSQLAITTERRAEYSVDICLSSTDQNRWKIRFCSYLGDEKKDVETNFK